MRIKSVFTYGVLTSHIVIEPSPEGHDITLAVLPTNRSAEAWQKSLMPKLKEIERDCPPESVPAVERSRRVGSLVRAHICRDKASKRSELAEIVTIPEWNPS